jgi:hypothetical protein
MAGSLPLADHGETFDVMPTEQSIVFSHHLRWRPRPVFQSYAAYTPALAHLNETFLVEQGAETIVASVAPIDSHFPMLEDSLSYRALLANYDVGLASPERLLVRRRPSPLHYGLTPLSAAKGRFDERLAIPPGKIIWAEIELEVSLLGRLRAAAYKPPPISIEILTATEASKQYRFIPAMATSGFLLSPLVEGTPDLAELFSLRSAEGRQAMAVARAFTLHCSRSCTASYQREFAVRFFELGFSRPETDR